MQYRNGHFVVDLSLSVKCDRRSAPAGQDDFLSLVVKVDKGSRGTLKVTCAGIRVTNLKNNTVILDEPLPGFDRYQYAAKAVPGSAKSKKGINWGAIDNTYPELNLTPGSKMHSAAYVRVAIDAPCLVEVALVGDVWGIKDPCQWQAVSVSVPLAK